MIENESWIILEFEISYLSDMPNGVARLCDLCGNFVPFAVKKHFSINP